VFKPRERERERERESEKLSPCRGVRNEMERDEACRLRDGGGGKGD
jgi:hypothetical protein